MRGILNYESSAKRAASGSDRDNHSKICVALLKIIHLYEVLVIRAVIRSPTKEKIAIIVIPVSVEF